MTDNRTALTQSRVTLWQFDDARGVPRVGEFRRSFDRGGTDVTYQFQDTTDGSIHMVSGSRLKKAHPISREATPMKQNAGAKLRTRIASFEDAGAFYQAHARRAGDAVKLANNTVLVPHYGMYQNLDGYSVRLHNTDIVTIFHNALVGLNSGGYSTVTTKARMNEVLAPFRITVVQKRGDWRVFDMDDPSPGKGIPFHDGMLIASGRMNADQHERSLKRNPRTRRNRPGKFEGTDDMGELLHEAIGDSSYVDDECGDVQGFGWYGLVTDFEFGGKRHQVIAHEDSQGFFDYTEYASKREAQQVFADIAEECAEFESEGDGEDY